MTTAILMTTNGTPSPDPLDAGEWQLYLQFLGDVSVLTDGGLS
jgi:hypothetical protein